MSLFLTIVQIVVSLVLIAVVLLQSQGSGLGRAFGGEGFYHSKRGAEKAVMVLTIVLSLIFFATSILNLLY